MKYAIISDIHSNLQALRTVLDLCKKDIDEIICLGDIVGYNANPSECINLIRINPKIKHIIKGNHDERSAQFANSNGNLRRSDYFYVSKDAMDGMIYSGSHISKGETIWLSKLPIQETIKVKRFRFGIVHSNPISMLSNDLWDYVLCQNDAQIAASFWVKNEKIQQGKINLCFFGHSHVPTFVEFDKKGKIINFDMGSHLENDTYTIRKDRHYFINCGAVGQSRNNGITSFGIFDTEEMTVKIQGFEYNWQKAQEVVRKAGYSERIANRLDPSFKDF